MTKALATMHAEHGLADGKRCGDCLAMVVVSTRHVQTRNVAVQQWGCRLFRATSDVRTRWARTWPACGSFKAVG
jgi:hypothetical protein